jgi:hypothetical protein
LWASYETALARRLLAMHRLHFRNRLRQLKHHDPEPRHKTRAVEPQRGHKNGERGVVRRFAVRRIYGTEILRISDAAVSLSRVFGTGVALLDSHQQIGLGNALGRTTNAWIERGALMGTLTFNQTLEGKKAEGTVARNEITGISIGYRVQDYEITDSDGNIIDPAIDHLRWSDDDLTFNASSKLA